MAKFKIKSGTYTGTGSGFSVSGLGFTPNFGFIKATDSTSDGGQIKWTGGLSSSQSFDPSGSSSPVTDGITSFDADGFTVSTNSTVNTSGSTYTWVMMSIPSANMEGGTYTGNGTSSNPVTALGNGDLLIIKRAGSAQGGWIFGSNSPKRATWTTNNPASAVSITGTGFTVNTTSSVVNSNGSTYFYFILKVNPAWGVQSSYTGDGVDGRNLTLGFTPEFIWIKGNNTSSAVVFRSLNGNTGLNTTFWVANTAEGSNQVQAFIPGGVELGNGSEVNIISKNYDYLALKNEVTVTPTSTTKSIQYTIKGAVSTTKSIQYTIKGQVSTTKSIAYKIKGSISNTKQIIYKVKTSLSVTKSIAYAVKKSNSITKSLAYRVKTSLSITKSLAYKVKTQQSITKSLRYGVLKTNSTTKGIDYKVKVSSSTSKSIQYEVASATSSVNITKSLSYAIKGTGSVTKVLAYSVKRSVSVTKQITYKIKASLSQSKSLGYAVKQSNQVNLGITYNIHVRIYPYSSKSTPFTKKPIPYTEKTNVYRGYSVKSNH